MNRQIVSPATLFLVSTLSLACHGAGAEPAQLGYERWTPTANLSGVIFDKSPAWYYGTYADMLSLVNVGDSSAPPAPYRLIDIEMTPHLEHGFRMDAVWIENQGSFKTRSWLLHNVTADDVKLLPQLRDAAILDLESYEEVWGVPTRYAVILRENPHEFPTKVLLEVSWATIESELRHGEWRPIDIDVLRRPDFDYPEPEAWEDVRFNAVLVHNSGVNFVHTIIDNALLPSEIYYPASAGYQLVDMEPMMVCVNPVSVCPTRVNEPCEKSCDVSEKFLAIYVADALPFSLEWGMTTSALDAESYGLLEFDEVAGQLGRCVDVEGNFWNSYYNPTGRSGVFLLP